jgi:hypothetical protein
VSVRTAASYYGWLYCVAMRRALFQDGRIFEHQIPHCGTWFTTTHRIKKELSICQSLLCLDLVSFPVLSQIKPQAPKIILLSFWSNNKTAFIPFCGINAPARASAVTQTRFSGGTLSRGTDYILSQCKKKEKFLHSPLPFSL